jgi:predicted component of viral defense system (DUF524 family)
MAVWRVALLAAMKAVALQAGEKDSYGAALSGLSCSVALMALKPVEDLGDEKVLRMVVWMVAL